MRGVTATGFYTTHRPLACPLAEGFFVGRGNPNDEDDDADSAESAPSAEVTTR